MIFKIAKKATSHQDNVRSVSSAKADHMTNPNREGGGMHKHFSSQGKKFKV
jgi:hypothetical protein